jgi:uncharacterized protein (DUF1697 family)
MTVFIAFLRAINVGGRTVKMDQLRSLFEALPYKDVETFIASGNVIFRSPTEDTRALEQQIEAHLRQALGYEVATFVRTAAEVAGVAAYAPFPADEIENNTLYVGFLQRPPCDDALGKLALTDAGLLRRDCFVLETCVRRGIPVATVIGGGYSMDIDALARRHTLVHRAASEMWKSV